MAVKKAKAKVEAPVVEEKVVAGKIVSRKIEKNELISLQVEGKLVGYNPATGIGTVRSEGLKTVWPGGGAK